MILPWIFLIFFPLFSSVAAFPGKLDLPRSVCPFVQGCSCIRENVRELECRNIGVETIKQLSEHYRSLEVLTVNEWADSSDLDLTGFDVLPKLVNLTVRASKLYSVALDTRLSHLKILSLSSNRLSDFEQLCNVTRLLPSLKTLSLTENRFETLHPCVEEITAESIDLSSNKLTSVGNFSESLVHLDLSWNSLPNVTDLPANLVSLNLSRNPLTEVDFPAEMPSLVTLDLSETKITQIPSLNASKLHNLIVDKSSIFVFNLNRMISPRLKRLSLRESEKLSYVTGALPRSISSFSMTDSLVDAFPRDFFSGVDALHEADVVRNPFDCDPCIVQWAAPFTELFRSQVNCSITPQNASSCLLGISENQEIEYFQKFGRDAVIPCEAYGNPPPVVEWWLYRPATYLGRYDPATNDEYYEGVSPATRERFSIQGYGLLLHHVNKSSIERYVCIASNVHGNKTAILKFRLNYRDWYSHNLFESVFWGALAFCIVICALSFLLNITWILTRKSILWWIQRAERLSRVRKMVEAMEKYRVRQLENLQDKYTRRVQLVRDNYHSQVEQLRMSYALQAERFRDYRAAQMETVTSHLENIRENYQQQLNRVREYGSKRAEVLWESYERQVNRMKAFSLQHRLKLMRQYKVKQRHLNKLLESFNESHSPDTMRKHEEEVLAALELPVAPVTAEDHALSRSSSFYSLPEYVLDDDGVLRPSPLVPKTIHFKRNLKPDRKQDE